MTDAELIARLRDEHVAASRTEAADRIEALSISNATLIAERDALQAWKRYWSGEYDTVLAGRADECTRAEAAEAKLAKAVEALKIIDALDPESLVSGCSRDALSGLVNLMGAKSRAAVAEIKSHSDEFATQKGESHE